MQGADREQAEALARGDLEGAGVSSPLKELLAYCGKLTRTPQAMTASDVEGLRQVGWRDPQIAEAVYVTGMFAFFNRVADAFGLVDPAYGTLEAPAVQPATHYRPDA